MTYMFRPCSSEKISPPRRTSADRIELTDTQLKRSDTAVNGAFWEKGVAITILIVIII